MNIRDYFGEATEYDKKAMLEVKKPKSWCKSVSAFANSFGGILIFGVTDDDVVVGIENASQVGEQISEIIKTHIDPIPQVILNYHTEDDKNLVFLQVLPGDNTPYYYCADGVYEAYIRIGNESVKAGAEDLKRLVLRGKNMTYDSLLTDMDFQDFSFSGLRAHYRECSGESMADKELLSFGLVDKSGKLTNAGALLADNSPIRCSRLFCTRWNGLDKSGGSVDALDDAEYSGGIVELLHNGMNFIKRNTRTAWYKTPTARIDLPEYNERCCFEALVNALVHRDYLIAGSEIHIDIYDNRLVIYSPGGMVDGTLIQDRLIDEIPSVRRNPVIADVFQRLGLMERKGSGLNKIIYWNKTMHNFEPTKFPKLFSSRTEFTITFFNLNYKETGEVTKETGEVTKETGEVTKETGEVTKDTGEVTKETGEVTKETENMDNLAARVIEGLQAHPENSVKALAEQLGVNRDTVQYHINKLKVAKMIKHVGPSKGGYWEILD